MKPTPSNIAVARNLRRLRKKLGISQEACAEKCELHRTYIGAVERGERNITLETLDRIAHALGTNALNLLTPGGGGMNYPERISQSGKTIYDGVREGDNLFLPVAELEAALRCSLIGLNLDYPLRTRSKVLKSRICEIL